MIVRLWEHAGTGLIVPHSTGITYSNQVGGNACHQMSIEGFFVPIANDCGLAPNHELRSPENELFQHFTKHPSWDGLAERDADVIERIFSTIPLWCGINVRRDMLAQSYEAWVHVRVDYKSDSCGILEGCTNPFDAILTWTNTD